jgi:hypothetical protein
MRNGWAAATPSVRLAVPVISIVWLVMIGDFQSRHPGSKLETRNQKVEIGEKRKGAN